MLNYLNSRCIIYSSIFQWMREEIDHLEKIRPHHENLLQVLNDKISSMELELNELRV